MNQRPSRITATGRCSARISASGSPASTSRSACFPASIAPGHAIDPQRLGRIACRGGNRLRRAHAAIEQALQLVVQAEARHQVEERRIAAGDDPGPAPDQMAGEDLHAGKRRAPLDAQLARHCPRILLFPPGPQRPWGVGHLRVVVMPRIPGRADRVPHGLGDRHPYAAGDDEIQQRSDPRGSKLGQKVRQCACPRRSGHSASAHPDRCSISSTPIAMASRDPRAPAGAPRRAGRGRAPAPGRPRSRGDPGWHTA